MTSTSTGAPRPKRGAPARSEASKKPKTVKVRGVSLSIPPTVPLRVIDQMGEIAEAGENATMRDMKLLLETVLGADEMEKVWNIDVDAGNGTLDALQDLFAEVIDKVLTATGITPGESPASGKS